MLPVVAIIGRQNVGKSSLLNAIVGRRLAIVHEHPGVTRDRFGVAVSLGDRRFELVDTGGLAPVDADPIFEQVRRQVDYALARAALVLFVTDAQEGVTPGDEEIARQLRRSKAPVLLVVNKVDHGRVETSDFYRLGFGDPIAVSAAHRHGIDRLKDRLEADVPASSETAAPEAVRVTIVGRRNVGKSTFVNALAGEERVIVSERPGTTRDAVDVELRRGKRAYVLTDTAGLRKRGKMDSPAEFFGHARAADRLRSATAVIFMLDAVDRVTAQDRRIARQIHAESKLCVVALNKWDLVGAKSTPKKYVEYLAKTLPVLSFAPVSCVSAKQGLNVWETMTLIGDLVEKARRRVTTADLNRVMAAAMERRRPQVRGTRAGKVYYAAQTAEVPPSFRLFVNDPSFFRPDYRAYLEGELRAKLGYDDLPVRLELVRRKRSPSKKRARGQGSRPY